MSVFKTLANIGIRDDHSFYQKRIRRFFNIINLIGFATAVPQFFLTYENDVISASFHFIWAFLILVSIACHHWIGFNTSRFITFSSVFLFGFLYAARIGPDAYAHIGSMTVIVACFIVYDLKKEWGYALFFLIVQLTGIIVVELDIFTEHSIALDNLEQIRITSLVSAVIFIIIQIAFFIRMSNANENEIIEELRASNTILKSTNEEKSLLLKEVHHRVKNNLQLITSLLRLQANNIKDEKLDLQFGEATSRIKSIALLHEKIYKQDSLAKIDFEEYIRTIGEDMIHSYSPEKQIVLSIQSELQKENNEALIPLALIFNELLSNSLKHGLKNRSEATISISIKKGENTDYELNYGDTGEWVAPKTEESFGMELIETLTEQLSGEIQMSLVENSPIFKITFNLNT
ncbi:MAG: two-component sensor histidine kinase [Crocinitomicaceae bacterium]|jgi:two-component sensor histidine kinase